MVFVSRAAQASITQRTLTKKPQRSSTPANRLYVSSASTSPWQLLASVLAQNNDPPPPRCIVEVVRISPASVRTSSLHSLLPLDIHSSNSRPTLERLASRRDGDEANVIFKADERGIRDDSGGSARAMEMFAKIGPA